MMALLVVTLPPDRRGSDAIAWAARARRQGADWLEVRNDLHPPGAVDLPALSAELPVLLSERAGPLTDLRGAQRVDRPLGSAGLAAPEPVPRLVSLHADRPLASDEAMEQWRAATLGPMDGVKHVEPLGEPKDASRLFETQRRLETFFGHGRVTVLATGPLALPFRCLLAVKNTLEYVALESEWAAAVGQRLLADALRERKARGSGPRKGILGSRIGHSRSPRVHPQPFDRIDLPEDAPIPELLDALHPHYAGFAVTSPFKKQVAEYVRAPFPAVNTLVRRASGWDAFNTDVEGARAVLDRLGSPEVTVLGDGGATTALRIAAANTGRKVHVVRRAQLPAEPITAPSVWTWPESVVPAERLRFADAPVAVITYGAPARRITALIRERGGRPLLLGAAWFIAQARAQRAFWAAGHQI